MVVLTKWEPAPVNAAIVLAAPHTQQSKSLNSRPDTTHSPHARFLCAEVALMDIAGLDPEEAT
jgi:hypothetical protein